MVAIRKSYPPGLREHRPALHAGRGWNVTGGMCVTAYMLCTVKPDLAGRTNDSKRGAEKRKWGHEHGYKAFSKKQD